MEPVYIFDVNMSNELCEIMDRNGSDKGKIDLHSSWHNYTKFYNSIFDDLKYETIRLFELGLGTHNRNIPSNMAGSRCKPGGSLYGWAEYFPNAKIYGADIDVEILFTTDKIKTYYCDQLNSHTIKYMWNEDELKEDFDIIIDDGLHEFNANVCFFENSIHKLKKNGFFIIEDIKNSDFDIYNAKINFWKEKHCNFHFTLLQIQSPWNNIDNNLLVIKRLN